MMKRFSLSCLLLLLALEGRAVTNQPASTSLLLDEKTVIEMTTHLQEYETQLTLTGKCTSASGGPAAILVNRWGVEFATIYPDAELDMHSVVSANNLAGLLEGKVDLVPMSRPLEGEEVRRFQAKFGYEPTQIIVAQDAVGVYVNKNNPIAGLSLAQLDAIYSRDAKRGGGRPEFWSELGVTGPLAEARISRISLSRAHGSYRFFQDRVMQGEDYRFSVSFEAVASSLVQAVGADEAAVGFASVMFATARTRFVPLQASDGRYLLPSYENTLRGQYPLVRPLRIVFHRKPDGSMNRVAREFLRLAISRRGQRIIAWAGNYPITLEQQDDARQRIGQ